MVKELLSFNEEVTSAIHSHQPIVALAPSMSHSDLSKTTHMVEQLIRDNGAVPATISIFQGKIHIGTDAHILEDLANQPELIKASKRDLAYTLSHKISASTTVAATMYCAYLAKLPLYITGGIGGVHHHVNESFDISADLIELSSTPVTVVCSGAKSILDLPKTLAMLETHGVTIVGYKTDEFPAFYSQTSGLSILHRLNNAEAIAELMHYQRLLKLNNGIIVAHPIPQSAEIPDSQIKPILQQALQETKSSNEKVITPLLLKRIAELTAGQSLEANIELLKNNAILGAQIAIAYKQNLNVNICTHSV